MTESFDESGPVDYLVVEFPGSKFTGEIMPELADLVQRGIVRVLDLVLIKKDDDGSYEAFEFADIEDGALGELRAWNANWPTCSARTTSPPSPRLSSRAAPPGCWSTRTSGLHRLPRRSAGPAVTSSQVAGSRSRHSSPLWQMKPTRRRDGGRGGAWRPATRRPSQ